MAIVITNGKLYMYLNENGKYRKTDDITKALQYESVNKAREYMNKAIVKTKGFYILNTLTNKIIWKNMTDKEKIELAEQKEALNNIKRYGNGKIKRHNFSTTERRFIYDKYDGRCQLCGRKILFEDATMDHIISLAQGGADTLENVQLCCYEDNLFKGAILPEDFLKRITTIFMYQMDKKNKHKLLWKITYNMLERMI